MKIVNARIDERLVHGMVATFWIPTLKVDRVICADDESANNPVIKNALRMATPQGVSLSVITVEKAITNLLSEKYGEEKIMIVAKKVEVYEKMIDAGIGLTTITLGNMNVINKPLDAKIVTNFLNVTLSEKKVFEKLHDEAIALEIRLIPGDSPTDFYSIMESKF